MGNKKKPEKKEKFNLVFDDSKRRDFLLGFRKRKLQRKKRAGEELTQKLKEERNRIKKENKESYKKLVVSHTPIPELEQLLKNEYEDAEEDVTVKIVEISSAEMNDSGRWIGENRVKVDNKPVDKPKKVSKAITVTDELPGMELEKNEDHSETTIRSNHSETESKLDSENLKSRSEIKKLLKSKATKSIKNSKAYKMKINLDRAKNKKQAKRKEHLEQLRLKKLPAAKLRKREKKEKKWNKNKRSFKTKNKDDDK